VAELSAVDRVGHSWVEIELADMGRKKHLRVKALVDMGATLTVLPRRLAEELEIEPVSTEHVMTGAGPVRVERGRAWIKLGGKEEAFPVWISSFVDKVLLGVVVLESLGFEVDPTTGTLREKPLLMYSQEAH